MIIDLDIVRKKGVTDAVLKAAFNKPRADMDPKHKALVDRIRSRVQNGINYNLQNYRTFFALDTAWDTPFRQLSNTLLLNLDGKDPTNETVLNQLKDFGLTSLIQTRDYEDPKTKKKMSVIDAPAFFKITVPLVRAYLTIRWAKIINDRHQIPLFKYEPTRDTPENRLRCEVITDRVQQMSSDYGYFEVMKQAVFQMLHYGFCLVFPQEEWDSVEQWKAGDDGKPEKKVAREGLRYSTPHPTRTFYDQAHRLDTFNTDTGCAFAGYWKVVRYGDIEKNEKFWNRDKVSIGTTDWISGHTGFFASVTSACTMQFPQAFCQSGAMGLDRENVLANGLYTGDLNDAAVTLTEYFEKLVPSEHGLGEYDCPLWFRFIIASDDTVLYCAPLPYTPVFYMGYDADANRAQNASLSLEVLPHQDQVSNLLSQLLLTTKQNLTNLTLVDTDMVDEEDIKKMENWGERFFRSLNLQRFSSKRWKAGQNNPQGAIQSFRFPQMDTTSLANAIKIVLDILERTLVMSSQEVAQAASHEQTREEVRSINQSTSSRLTFTATPVDLAAIAWKRQLYEALMAYGDPDFEAAASADLADKIGKEQMEKLGFTVAYEPDDIASNKSMTVRVKDKTAITMTSFASVRDGLDRTDNVAAATAMSNFLIGILNNPMMAEKIGGEQALELMNLIGRLAGFPRDFKLKDIAPNAKTPDQQAEAARGELQKMAEQVLAKAQETAQQTAMQASQQAGAAIQQLQQQVGAALEDIKKGIMPLVQAVKTETQKNEAQDAAMKQIIQAVEGLTQTVQQVEQILQAPQQPPAMPPPNAAPPQAAAPGGYIETTGQPPLA